MKKAKFIWKKYLPMKASLKKSGLSGADKALCIGISFVAAGLISYLFYHSIIAMVLIIPVYILVCKLYINYKKEREVRELKREFRDGISAYSAAIRVGYSPENAAKEALKEIRRIYGEYAILAKEFEIILRKLSLGESFEKALLNLAERSEIEEIKDMSELFEIARKSGGSLPSILNDSVRILDEKSRLAEEIETIITSKKLEQRIMSLMPAGILVYVNFTAPDFVAPLYEGFIGRIVMTVALCIYIVTVLAGERIMRVNI